MQVRRDPSVYPGSVSPHSPECGLVATLGFTRVLANAATSPSLPVACSRFGVAAFARMRVGDDASVYPRSGERGYVTVSYRPDQPGARSAAGNTRTEK